MLLAEILNSPHVYNFVQRATGWHGTGLRTVIENDVRPLSGDKVLDIGCGTGAALEWMTAVDYTGVDSNPRYLAFARTRHGARSSFVERDVTSPSVNFDPEFDVILMLGVLHHLRDEEAEQVLRRARGWLADGGRVIACDICRHPEQSRLGRLLVALDRGRHVRTPAGYNRLVDPHFGAVEVRLRRDLLRLPYVLVVMDCRI